MYEKVLLKIKNRSIIINKNKNYYSFLNSLFDLFY